MVELSVLDRGASREIFKRGKEGTEEERRVREIITGREMCYPRGLLLIASLMSLWDVLVGCWIWIQLCRLRSVRILAQQTTAQFDMDFFFSIPDIATCVPQRFSPIRSGLAVMDWHPLSVKTALWLFNEAIWQRKPPLPLVLLVFK